jgi:4-alpha-glucanotransferase
LLALIKEDDTVAQLRLALVIHNHQPIGNFDDVFHRAFEDSYAPFLEVLKEFPSLAITLHNSGSLLEWLVEHRPEYLDLVRELCERGQLEIIGGPFYEPILAGIPRRDRIGQIESYSNYLENLLGQPIRGMWVPERVWEQSFASDIVDAGIEYTVLDDYHFRCAGLDDDQLSSYFLTEDEGRLLKIFPVAERLRYAIPFEAPHRSIEFLRGVYEKNPNAIVTFGDDGEKFGVWPETKKTCYEEGWLRSFFQLLQDNGEWLRTVTLKECVEHVPPAGQIYLPDSSYREMTEWVLPSERQAEYLGLRHKKEHSDPDWPALNKFLRGGFWRNFRAKYPETNDMYSRMLQISNRLEQLGDADYDRDHVDALNDARQELYRGQCNCSYWHGAFGGLYLPHLRHAIYHHLIAADNILEHVASELSPVAESNQGRASKDWVRIEHDDFNLDARKEICISGNRLVAMLSPATGGHLYELDVRTIKHNLLATLNRRPEIYHDAIIQAANGNTDGINAPSIQGEIRCKQEGLHNKIAYDAYPRKALVDHFFQPGLTITDFQKGDGLISDFHTGGYQSIIRRSRDRVEACMARKSQLSSYAVQVTKVVALDREKGGDLIVHYQIENLPPGLPVHFGVEFNFSGLPGGAPDRYYYDQHGQRLGQLESVLSLLDVGRIGLVDEWLGIDVSLDISKPSGMWAFPIETVSQSEGGFETVHQNCCLVPHWEFVVPENGIWEVDITLAVDTSAARAKEMLQLANALKH